MLDYKKFLENVENVNPSCKERIISLYWYYHKVKPENTYSLNQIIENIEAANFGKQNKSRLKGQLLRDKRVVKNGGDSFKVAIKEMSSLNEKYSKYLITDILPESNSIIELTLFNNSRGYIKKVVMQLNHSFDQGLFDCCAVMCRRLLETLIIELFEENSHEDDIKDQDGHYFMLSGLLSRLENQQFCTIGRSTIDALKKFKKLGDLSAHNRRFNARYKDIEDIKFDLRVASEELLILCNQI